MHCRTTYASFCSSVYNLTSASNPLQCRLILWKGQTRGDRERGNKDPMTEKRTHIWLWLFKRFILHFQLPHTGLVCSPSTSCWPPLACTCNLKNHNHSARQPFAGFPYVRVAPPAADATTRRQTGRASRAVLVHCQRLSAETRTSHSHRNR